VHVKARHADNSRCRLIECLDEPLSGQCLLLQYAEQGHLNVFQRLAGTKRRFDAGQQRSYRCGLFSWAWRPPIRSSRGDTRSWLTYRIQQYVYCMLITTRLLGVLLGRFGFPPCSAIWIPAFVRALRRYYTTVRLPINLHVGLTGSRPSPTGPHCTSFVH